ncbi:hypothetical protein CEXT_702921 [Caerostris extrusa]|uniref:Uncharacterized protein n=1 Tax=Caerostris extrusa TaxID=172846 RepID=A0AAV4WAQ1_CAEEX|nr:hypothetical protein CEXT_702921 [Caerostris extrusa]
MSPSLLMPLPGKFIFLFYYRVEEGHLANRRNLVEPIYEKKSPARWCPPLTENKAPYLPVPDHPEENHLSVPSFPTREMRTDDMKGETKDRRREKGKKRKVGNDKMRKKSAGSWRIEVMGEERTFNSHGGDTSRVSYTVLGAY